MALARRSGARFQANIWPGFVDAMTALLLVLMFVLSIFMIVQFVLRDQVTEREQEIDELGLQIAGLANALGLEQQRVGALEGEVESLTGDLTAAEAEAAAQSALIATLSAEADAAAARIETLTGEADAAAARIATFEEQVAALLADNRALDADLTATRTELAGTATALEAAEAARDRTAAELAASQDEAAAEAARNAALNLALAQARDEIDAGTEAARLAAARREALEALLSDMRARSAEQAAALETAEADLAAQAEALGAEEAARLAEAAAAEALRARLADSSAELTALTLRLEEERQRAEDTLTLLAAAEAAQARLAEENADRAEALSAAERNAALLAVAEEELAAEREISLEGQRQLALLNQQTTALNRQLSSLQAVLDEALEREAEANVQIETLGSDLNTALAAVAAEQRRRAELEAAERRRLEEEARDLQSYRSEFFGRVREILGDREEIRVVGDRFVFSSEVLFEPGSAELNTGGRAQLADVAAIIREIQGEIPLEINWILRVDGHTDDIPISGGTFADNWELSQARALSVVRYLIDTQDLPAERLAANGFGEFQPIDPRPTAEARARNRRIELKFTER
ncbi:MAG: peptidoglycan -binding protein [Pseudomonadota bacterium]